MVRIVRILSCAAVAAAIWLSALQLDLAPAQRVAVLLVRRAVQLDLHCVLHCCPSPCLQLLGSDRRVCSSSRSSAWRRSGRTCSAPWCMAWPPSARVQRSCRRCRRCGWCALLGCAAWQTPQLHLLPCRRCLAFTPHALVQDIALARVELAARGVTVDPTAGR